MAKPKHRSIVSRTWSHSEANSGCRWYEGLENAEGISVSELPDEVQKRLTVVVREIRKLDGVANQS